MRIYNPSLGRFLSLDPMLFTYPYKSQYDFAENTPIYGADLDGRELDPKTIMDGIHYVVEMTSREVAEAATKDPKLLFGYGYMNAVATQFDVKGAMIESVKEAWEEIKHSQLGTVDPSIAKDNAKRMCKDFIQLQEFFDAVENYNKLDPYAQGQIKGITDFIKAQLLAGLIGAAAEAAVLAEARFTKAGIKMPPRPIKTPIAAPAEAEEFITGELRMSEQPFGNKGTFSEFNNLGELAQKFEGKNLANATDDLLNSGWTKMEGDFGSKTVFEKRVGKERYYAVWESSNMEHSSDGKPTSYWKLSKGKIHGSKGNVIRVSDAKNFKDN